MKHLCTSLRRGMTLVELLIAITILAIITAAAAFLLYTCLQVDSQAMSSTALQREGTALMDRLTTQIRNTPYLLIPNDANQTTRTLIAVCGTINNDNDYYFGDTRFPRVDEDAPADMTKDNKSGIKGIDDNGNGLTDEGLNPDDDEGANSNEDPVNGIDDDADGDIDEDADADMSGDNKPGLIYMDDDGDGQVDEASQNDDDEDGSNDEDPLDPLVISWDGANTLTQKQMPGTTVDTLSTHVTAFAAGFQKSTATTLPRVLVRFTITTEAGSQTFAEYVYPRNILQQTGKKVQ